MSKNLRIPLFGALTLVVLSFLAWVAFFGDDEPEQAKDEVEASESIRDKLHSRLSGNLEGKAQPGPIVEVGGATQPDNLPQPQVNVGQSTPPSTDEVQAEANEDAPVEVAGSTNPGQPGSVITYTIKPGDSVSVIAHRHGCKTTDIYRLNERIQKSNAHKIQVGWKIQVLDAKGIGGGEVVKAASQSKKSNPSVAAPKPAASKPSGVTYREPKESQSFTTAKTHTLKSGDGFFTLSIEYYNSKAHWRLIRDANPDWDPFDFEPGETIVIPALNPQDEVVEKSQPKTRSGAGLPFER